MLEKCMAKLLKHQFEKNAGYTPIAKGIKGMYHLSYMDDGDPYHTLDIYYPEEGNKKYPLIYYVHGGAWVACDKEMNRAYAEYLASFGYCVVNMSYRLLPKCDLLGQIQDISAALSFCDEIDIAAADKNAVIFMGDSAGAHLISTVYCLMLRPALQKKFCISLKALNVRAMVLQNTVSDLSVFVNRDTWYFKQMCKLMFGKHYKTCDVLHSCSFLELVSEDMKKVPIVCIGSEHDPLFPQSKSMVEYLQSHSWNCQTIFWHKEDPARLNHVFQVLHPEWEESRSTHARLFRILKEVVEDGTDDGCSTTMACE